jgi:hypothetical protein
VTPVSAVDQDGELERIDVPDPAPEVHRDDLLERDAVKGHGLAAVRQLDGRDHRSATRTGTRPRPLVRPARALPITAPNERA